MTWPGHTVGLKARRAKVSLCPEKASEETERVKEAMSPGVSPWSRGFATRGRATACPTFESA